MKTTTNLLKIIVIGAVIAIGLAGVPAFAQVLPGKFANAAERDAYIKSDNDTSPYYIVAEGGDSETTRTLLSTYRKLDEVVWLSNSNGLYAYFSAGEKGYHHMVMFVWTDDKEEAADAVKKLNEGKPGTAWGPFECGPSEAKSNAALKRILGALARYIETNKAPSDW
jgi:hypothetical protein